eukprot:5098286-Amphidinium_carterae.1
METVPDRVVHEQWPKIIAYLASKDETCEHLAVILAAMAQNIFETLQHQLMTAHMIPLPKAPGKFRPIYIASALRRITSKIFNKIIMPEVTPIVEEHQYTLERASGGEALHKETLMLLATNPDHGLLSLDVSNAFNSLESQQTMHNSTQQHLPAWSHMLAGFVDSDHDTPIFWHNAL